METLWKIFGIRNTINPVDRYGFYERLLKDINSLKYRSLDFSQQIYRLFLILVLEKAKTKVHHDLLPKIVKLMPVDDYWHVFKAASEYYGQRVGLKLPSVIVQGQFLNKLYNQTMFDILLDPSVKISFGSLLGSAALTAEWVNCCVLENQTESAMILITRYEKLVLDHAKVKLWMASQKCDFYNRLNRMQISNKGQCEKSDSKMLEFFLKFKEVFFILLGRVRSGIFYHLFLY